MLSHLIHWSLAFGAEAGILGATLYMLVGALFVRHTFCKYMCPVGLMQLLFGWFSPI